MDYEQFVATKLAIQPPTGIADIPVLHESLFPHQRDLVTFALKRGRAAIFAATGLGKTAMQLEWARIVAGHTGGVVLILAPLSVAAQTVAEGARIGVDVTYVRDGKDITSKGIYITNYDRLHRFDDVQVSAVVLDESSAIKHHDAKTLRTLLDRFAVTPFKLCATATPSPNDYTELGTHAEFLGICTRTEMLAEYFCHDGGETQVWRLKGHARDLFWRFVSQWGALVRSPSDLGYDASGYALPPLTIHQHTIDATDGTAKAAGLLFVEPAQSLSERRSARRASLEDRAKACADIVNADRQPWIVWCDLNAEADALKSLIPDAIEVRGNDDADTKESRLHAFSQGAARVLITKPSIAGFGLNWQHCARVAFVGITDSWESYHQAIRRCWRFGQSKPVDVHVFASELEGAVVRNLQRKEEDAARMAETLSEATRDMIREAITGASRQTNNYAPGRIVMPSWLITERDHDH